MSGRGWKLKPEQRARLGRYGDFFTIRACVVFFGRVSMIVLEGVTSWNDGAAVLGDKMDSPWGKLENFINVFSRVILDICSSITIFRNQTWPCLVLQFFIGVAHLATLTLTERVDTPSPIENNICTWKRVSGCQASGDSEASGETDGSEESGASGDTDGSGDTEGSEDTEASGDSGNCRGILNPEACAAESNCEYRETNQGICSIDETLRCSGTTEKSCHIAVNAEMRERQQAQQAQIDEKNRTLLYLNTVKDVLNLVSLFVASESTPDTRSSLSDPLLARPPTFVGRPRPGT